MKKRPLSIYILAAAHLLAPLFTVIFSRVVKNQTLAFDTLFTAESIAMNWPGYLLPIIGGVCIYLCKKWSLVVYLISMVTLFTVSYANFASEQSGGSVLLLSLVWFINVAVVIYFLRPALRQIYTDPKLRWWEQSKRYQSLIDATFTSANQTGSGQILNISKSGLFLKTDTSLENSETIEVKISDGDSTLTPLTGEIIVHKQLGEGVGVRFEKNGTNVKTAKTIIKNLR